MRGFGRQVLLQAHSVLRCLLLPYSVALQGPQSLESVPIDLSLSLYHPQQVTGLLLMTLTTMTTHLLSTGAHVLNVLAHPLHLLITKETRRIYPHCVLTVLMSLLGLLGGLVQNLLPQHGLE
jgi:hypothetical protein